ncbi:MAG: YceI family protein [Ktedonobacteraceae bacterium]|nr:YceI family protein [Ktedonobacteraceae bacterium]
MNKRFLWFTGIAVILVVAGIAYASHFASTVTQTHTAAGALIVPTTTPIITAATRSFTIVPAQTTASYSVFENLIFQNKPNNDAVGATHSVQGSFKVQTGSSPIIEGLNMQVDLRTLQTDSMMRDNYVRKNSLQTDTYPFATFVSVSTQGLPSSYSDGRTVHFQLIGNMTMHGKTNKEVFDLQGKIVGSTITGTAISTIYMTDFGIQPPDLANIAIAQNKVVVTLTFRANEV